MSVQGGPYITNNGLVLAVDFANAKSYVSGSSTVYNLDPIVSSSTGSLFNGPVFVNENRGILSFDGVNDYVRINNFTGLPTGSSPRTISIWFNTTSASWVGNTNNLFFYGTPNVNGQTFGIDFDVYPVMELFTWGSNNYDFIWSSSFLDSGWKNLTVTYNGSSTVSIYENGNFRTSKTNLVTTNTANTDIWLGSINPSFQSWYFDGKISSLKIYNRALSASEVLQDYNAIKGRFPLPPENISASFWLPFEFDTLTTANLAANDNSAGSWELNNTRNLLGISGSIAQFRNTFSVNYLSDVGTRGLAYNVNGLSGGGAASNMRFAAPVGISRYSMRFYYYLPDMDTFNIYGIYRGLNGSGFGFTGDGIFRHIKNPTVTLEGIPISTVNAWYRVEIYWEQNGRHIQSVYNAANQLVGTQEATGGSQSISFFNFFYDSSPGGTTNATSNAYMDNLIIDWVNAKFPIGP